MTATARADEASMPSMQAPARPLRPMRRRQRTRGFGARDGADDRGRAVGAVVVDEDHFPMRASEHALEGADESGDIVALVEGCDNDRQLRRCPGMRALRGRHEAGGRSILIEGEVHRAPS